MTAAAQSPAALLPKTEQRRAFGVAAGAHVLHDGYTDLIYVMLPIWQAEFGLSYAAVGMLRGLFAGAMASLQIPAGLLSERLGGAVVLAAGTALAGLGFCFAGLSVGFAMLVAALLIGGVGASTQHPIGSALVARAYSGAQSMKALGGYNFSGDIGKMTVPAMAAFMMILLPWRPTVIILGAAGLVAAAAILLLTPRLPDERQATTANAQPNHGVRAPRHAFPIMLSIAVIDNATRTGFLTFLPFVLTAKGAGLPLIGIALALVFAGGAAGKLVCAFISARIGAIPTVLLTEAFTTLAILGLLPLPLEAAIVLLPFLGIALNGTSSALYGSVPDLVAPEKRARAFGVFYTGSIGAGAVAPAIFGVGADALGITAAVTIVAATVLLTLPLAAILRPAFAVIDKNRRTV
jgi:MFS family permease